MPAGPGCDRVWPPLLLAVLVQVASSFFAGCRNTALLRLVEQDSRPLGWRVQVAASPEGVPELSCLQSWRQQR